MGANPGPSGSRMGEGRLQDTLESRSSPLNLSPSAPSSPLLRGEEGTVVAGDRCPSREGSDNESASGGVGQTCLLQPFIPCSKGYWRVSSGPRRKCPEQVRQLSSFSNGDSQVSTTFSASGRLGMLNRPDRRVLPCTAQQVVEEIPTPGTVKVGGILFYGAPVWSEHSSAGVHQDSHGCGIFPETVGPPTTCIPRRLASPVRGPSDLREGGLSDTRLARVSGISGKREEVCADPVTGISVSGTLLRHRLVPGTPGRPLSGQGLDGRKEAKSALDHHSQGSLADHRDVWRSRRLCAPGASESPPHSTLAPSSLVGMGRGLGCPVARHARSDPSSEELGRSGVAFRRCASPGPGTDSDSVYRRVAVRLGSPPRTPDGVRDLVSPGESRTHQCSRAEGNFEGVSDLCGSAAFPKCPPLNRQRHLCLLSTEARRNEGTTHVRPRLRALSVPREGKDKVGSQAHSFHKECSSRLPLSSQSSPHGVGPGRGDLRLSAGSGSTVECRPVRHVHERSVGNICKSVPRPVSGGSGCSVNPVGFSGNSICLSSLEDAPVCSQKDQRGLHPAGSGNSTKLATPGLVSRPTTTVRVKRTAASAHRQSVVSRPVGRPESASVVSSRMDAIGVSLNSHGYSNQVAETVASAGRTSTSVVYDAKWRLYTDWCKSRQVNPVDPTGPQLADFFTYLFYDKGLQFSTLRGYKASILSVLSRSAPLSPYTDSVLKGLFKAFQLQRPVVARSLPVWDLGIVLQGLKRPPFEPIRKSSLRLLSLKTLFLFTLAAGARRGEILALIRTGIHFTDHCEEVLVYPDPIFIPKTRLGVSSTRPFVVEALKRHVSRESEDRLLCPVRALQAFVDRTKDPAFLAGRTRLFLPLGDSKGNLSAHSHKVQIITTIEEAYAAMDMRLAEDFKLRMHDLRMLSFSLASASGVTLDTILTAGRWKSHSTFTHYYLRSMAVYADSLFSLGPVSLPGSVVMPGSHRMTKK